MGFTMLLRLVWTIFLALIVAIPAIAGESLVPFVTVAAGDRSDISTPAEVVVRTAGEWQALWRRHTATAPVPRVDFSVDMVIAVFAGEADTSSRVAVLRVIRASDRLIVIVQRLEAEPGPEPVLVEGHTAFHVIRIPRTSLPVVFVPARTPDFY